MKKLDKKMSMFIIVVFFFGNLTIGQDFFFGNNKPVADAGADIKILSGGSISLDGSRSFVADGSKIKYQWIFAPGLALKSDNDFSSEISMETYGNTYLKSVKTYNKVLSLKLSDNEPGTKLEVVLKIKDRIGFEDMDTLIVEFFKPKAPADASVKTLTSTMQAPLELSSDALGNDDSLSGIFIKGFLDNKVTEVDAQIINSIIMNQIKTIGFNYEIFLDRDIKQNKRPKGYKDDCNTDPCIAKNAKRLGAEYVLSWNFAQAVDKLSLRIFKSNEPESLIDEVLLIGPYQQMNESGIYGLDTELRSSVSKLMAANNFKKDISTVDRLLMKNESLIAYGKYPLMLGVAYLFIDKLFMGEPDEPEPEMPPGFPHEP